MGLGALIGALVTAPLLALSYVAWTLVGLPFVPFTIFDWISRVLPGSIITAGIDTMVWSIRTLRLGATASAAKMAEQTMAIMVCLVAGAVAGGLIGLLRARRNAAQAAGVAIGLTAGVLVLLIARDLSTPSALPPAIRALWILAAFTAWGAALGWAAGRTSEATATAGYSAAVERVDRRRFLVRLGGATAVITVVGASVGALVGAKRSRGAVQGAGTLPAIPLPNADAAVKPAPGTRPELTPLAQHYRIDINTSLPVIAAESWRLKIGGLVEHPLELSLADLRGYEPMEQFITLACISNPVAGDLIGTARWTGVSLQRLLPDWKLNGTATHLKIRSADGFSEVVALDLIRADPHVMLTYAWDGVPLLAEHGFPLRIYIPDRYGMKQPKWIEAIEALDHPEDGYWVTRGWDREARMKATSVIDTVAVNMMISQPTADMRIPVGGMAHAGARGISKVEVQVNGGDWHAAQLRTPLSDRTWVIWRYEWPFQTGKHTFTVRCIDGRGAAQIVEEAPPHPSGASGLHGKSVRL
jgi:DMSO/TMAO reductase YedYZ molybdopterin-dependent catalytic subunit